MKILVFAYDLVLSGVTVNTIDLAEALRDIHGHKVVLYAGPGPMVEQVVEKGLRFLPAPCAYGRIHPSPVRIRELRDAVRRERPDLIYAWDWKQCIDAFFVEHLFLQVPIVVTDMSMNLQHLLPKTLPTTFGTPKILDQARAAGHRQVELLLPPVNINQNAPNAVDPQPFRERYGIVSSDIMIVIVSRLDTYMKGESLYRTLDAVSALGNDLPLRLMIVGEGDARANLERIADKINRKVGRAAVFLAGMLVDPRPAYAAADIVVGMGGSALRGMAFGKPVIIVGEQGFSAPFTPETADYFYYNGIYGLGDGSSDNTCLVRDIRRLAENLAQLPALGEFSRQFVLKHFDLEKVTARFADFCHVALSNQPRRYAAARDALRTAAVWVRERRFVPN